MKRYIKTDYNYPTYYAVECPDCKKEAKVEYFPNMHVIFTCSNCMSKKILSDNDRYNIHLKRNCPNCGKKVYAEQSNLKEVPDLLKIQCSHCQEQWEDKPNATSYRLKYETNGLKGDPYFNYPLWLQTQVKGDLFWAYNRAHLNEIRVYVEADLRERQTTYARTMVAWLPQFIKEAKNREAILKAIDRMIRK